MAAPVAAAPRISPAVLEPTTQTANTMQRVYDYFKDQNNPILIKIGLAALSVIAAIAAGYALGNVVLTLSGISAVVILGTVLETNRLEQQALKKQIASLEVTHLMSGQNRFLDERLLIIDIGERESESGDIDFLRPDEVQNPKRGTDKYGRQFYAFLIESNEDDARHVVVLFQKYTTGDVWHISGPEDFAQGPLNEAAKEQIEHLLFVQDHPRYHLVNQPDPEPAEFQQDQEAQWNVDDVD